MLDNIAVVLFSDGITVVAGCEPMFTMFVSEATVVTVVTVVTAVSVPVTAVVPPNRVTRMSAAVPAA